MFLLDKCKDGVGDVAQFRGDFFESIRAKKTQRGETEFPNEMWKNMEEKELKKRHTTTSAENGVRDP